MPQKGILAMDILVLSSTEFLLYFAHHYVYGVIVNKQEPIFPRGEALQGISVVQFTNSSQDFVWQKEPVMHRLLAGKKLRI